MPRDDHRNTGRAVVLALALGATLGACADPGFYTDRREGVSFQAGNAVASNLAAQTIDPWPRAAFNQQINGDGERTQKAIERYRTNKVTAPQGVSTSSIQFQPVLAAPVPTPTSNP